MQQKFRGAWMLLAAFSCPAFARPQQSLPTASGFHGSLQPASAIAVDSGRGFALHTPGDVAGTPRLEGVSDGRVLASRDLEHCHLVAVDAASASAVVATDAEDLLVVHAGEDAPHACGPFRVVSVLADRLVLEPTCAAGSTAIRQAWLSLAATSAEAVPQLLFGSPQGEPLLPAFPLPPASVQGPRRVRLEQPPP